MDQWGSYYIVLSRRDCYDVWRSIVGLFVRWKALGVPVNPGITASCRTICLQVRMATRKPLWG